MLQRSLHGALEKQINEQFLSKGEHLSKYELRRLRLDSQKEKERNLGFLQHVLYLLRGCYQGAHSNQNWKELDLRSTFFSNNNILIGHLLGYYDRRSIKDVLVQ